MNNLVEIVSVPVIVAIVYGALAGYKALVKGKEKLIKIIPILAAGLGVILGIIAFYAVPAAIAADNILTAILVGSASGLAATGTNQIWKQLIKKPEELLKLITKKSGTKDDKEDETDDGE